jgi:protein-disulfide isomerase
MLAPEIEEHIRLSMNLAEALNINGTPAFIAGEKVYPGLLTSEQLSQAIEDARSAQ